MDTLIYFVYQACLRIAYFIFLTVYVVLRRSL